MSTMPRAVPPVPSVPSVRSVPRAEQLAARFVEIRRVTCALCAPLGTEDYVIQSMPDCSPAKWHLAHTTWFFETFVLREHDPAYRGPPGYDYLFNSYYEGVGARHARSARGLISRPSVAEIYGYRARVDDLILGLLDAGVASEDIIERIELGLQHEQQHQELLLTDLQHGLSVNPLMPAYRPLDARAQEHAHAQPEAHGSDDPGSASVWVEEPGGVGSLGHRRDDGFAFDNEEPAHRVFVEPFEMRAERVTCAEVAAFIDDGGYRNPAWWLSDGFAFATSAGIGAPLYWQQEGTRWFRFSLYGRIPVNPRSPVCHVSYYEADAIARWAGARLPTEAEWELCARKAPAPGQHLEDDLLLPARASLSAFRGGAWTWTSSAYAAYPGFVARSGALGEYNGKFMVNQYVLRGGSCFTPRAHARLTYRNFFPAHTRFQVSGIRLARSR